MAAPKKLSVRSEKASAGKIAQTSRNTSAPAASTTMRSVRSAGGVKLTRFVKPMLAGIGEEPFDHPDWIFEVKWDGYRAIAETGDEVKLYSRNGLSFLSLYYPIAEALQKIKEPAILDGEIVVLNTSNKPDFQKLQQYHEHRSLSLVYYVFDCLSIGGKSIIHLPLVERKKLMKKLLPKSPIIRYSDHVEESGTTFFSNAVGMDLEGVIAKKANSVYVSGKRSGDWLKIKNHNTQEAIIAGYTAPRNSRQYFGALILAIRQHGQLKYIGHTGTGFTQQILKDVYTKLQPLHRPTSPFHHKIAVNAPVTWVEPVLVCNLKYTEITQDGILRHPVFQGLRIDKTAAEATSIDRPPKKSKRNR
jgi:bifunctional non-homologous end joining protein LigD